MVHLLDPVAKHRREVWLRIVLPLSLLAAGLLLILALLAIFVRNELSAIAGVLLIICILLPMLIIGLLLVAGMFLLVWAFRKLPAAIVPPLRATRQRTDAVVIWVPRHSERVARPLIALTVRLTRWEQFIGRLLGFARTENEPSPERTSETQ